MPEFCRRLQLATETGAAGSEAVTPGRIGRRIKPEGAQAGGRIVTRHHGVRRVPEKVAAELAAWRSTAPLPLPMPSRNMPAGASSVLAHIRHR